ncbi:RNA polymerase sigma factor ShbA [Pseudonocardia sp. GCM10023141]|uniref:RNA polymerase sigma factor ShbA n=1 Tax=Pseudonocardia sp. GCM10023141 TaxID=3252653 RepID=UPI003621AED9
MPADEVEVDRAAADRAAHRDAELTALAERAAAGETKALNTLLEKIRPTVLRYCRARLGGGDSGLQTAEDVAQDVLLAVCSAIPRYEPRGNPAMSFVIGIARNKVVDAYRAAGRDRSRPTDQIPDDIDDGPGPDVRVLQKTDAAQLRALLDQLPAAHREVLVMRIALQFSAAETAIALGSTAGAVRVTQHRALARLRALVAAQSAVEGV